MMKRKIFYQLLGAVLLWSTAFSFPIYAIDRGTETLADTTYNISSLGLESLPIEEQGVTIPYAEQMYNEGWFISPGDSFNKKYYLYK